MLDRVKAIADEHQKEIDERSQLLKNLEEKLQELDGYEDGSIQLEIKSYHGGSNPHVTLVDKGTRGGYDRILEVSAPNSQEVEIDWKYHAHGNTQMESALHGAGFQKGHNPRGGVSKLWTRGPSVAFTNVEEAEEAITEVLGGYIATQR